MCTVGILNRVHPEVPVALFANRDELYARPAAPPQLDAAGIAGGIDLQEGGTWLAVKANGRFAAVTNQRAAVVRVPGLRSRGHVVRAALAERDPDVAVRAMDPRAYNSMNLVYGDATAVRVAYFRHDTGTVEIDELPPGVWVLCNDRIDSPDFPRGQRLAGVLTANADVPWRIARPRIAAALGSHARVPVDDAPLPPPLTRELAEAMTALCIHSPLYGTRSSAILALAPGRVIEYLHAEGPPCTAPFVDYTSLVRGPA
jgi:uncharacterized protein with NRDE domain